MSAFIVTHKTIDNILSIRLNHELLAKYCYLKSEMDSIIQVPDYEIFNGLEKLGKEFLKLNCQSVEYRYNVKDEEELNYNKKTVEQYKFNYVDVSIKQALKSLNCLMYQSCEIEKYKENATWQKMDKLKQYFTETMINLDDEYRTSAWLDDYKTNCTRIA